MEDLLHDGAMNYAVFLRTYSIAGGSGDSVDDIATKLIGRAVATEQLRAASPRDLETHLRHCLGYTGDHGAGPEAGITRFVPFLALLDEICRDAAAASMRAIAL
ncbi:hypothetical protein [Pseudoduganella violaceinigra]|uniref:hypothetical protein n=1 Tax=Pseudoduganella violaceinigra TaxID=246602 RepID=UPI0012B61841|nr:hypothetical protein [Pseudoduganella violaceinigra]